MQGTVMNIMRIHIENQLRPKARGPTVQGTLHSDEYDEDAPEQQALSMQAAGQIESIRNFFQRNI